MIRKYSVGSLKGAVKTGMSKVELRFIACRLLGCVV